MSVKARQRFRERVVKGRTSSVSEPGVLYRSKKAVCETTNRTLKPLSVGIASDTSNKDFAECHGKSDIATGSLTASTELERMAAAIRASMSVKARQRFRERVVKGRTSSVSEPGVLYRSKKAVCETTNRTLKPLSVGIASDTSNKDFAECHGKSDIASGARISSRSPPSPWRRWCEAQL